MNNYHISILNDDHQYTTVGYIKANDGQEAISIIKEMASKSTEKDDLYFLKLMIDEAKEEGNDLIFYHSKFSIIHPPYENPGTTNITRDVYHVLDSGLIDEEIELLHSLTLRSPNLLESVIDFLFQQRCGNK